MTEVGPRIALDHMQLVAVRNPWPFSQVLSLKPVESTTSASPSQFAMESPIHSGSRSFGCAAAVQKELAIAMHVPFVENDDESWSLNEFLRKRRNPRHACRKTMSFRIVFAEIGAAFLVERVGPGL